MYYTCQERKYIIYTCPSHSRALWLFYRNVEDDVPASGHRLVCKGFGFTRWRTILFEHDAASSRHQPAIVVSTLSGAARSRTRQGSTDPGKSPRSFIRGLPNLRSRHRDRRLCRRIRKSAGCRENRGMHEGCQGTSRTISFQFYIFRKYFQFLFRSENYGLLSSSGRKARY